MPDSTRPIRVEPLTAPFDAAARPPGSKSLTNRALLLAALAEGASTLSNVLLADDTRVMLRALGTLGFDLDVDEKRETVSVEGRGGSIPAHAAELDLGNAGTAMRFLTAACCVDHGTYLLDGVERMRQRPIGELIGPLRDLGANITCVGREDYPPLEINSAGLSGGALTMQPTLSSQFISALLMIGPCCESDLSIAFDGPITSAPYVAMTLELMRRFGGGVTGPVADRICVAAGQRYRPLDYAVEPDASNASYFLAAAAVTPDASVEVTGLGADSLQGDARFAVRVLEKMGARVHQDADSTRVTGTGALRGIDVDLNELPDMVQTLACVAVFADAPTTIRNVGNLRIKETDRIAALQAELRKVGAAVEVQGDDLVIRPPAAGRVTDPPGGIDTYDDHRMAMSFAILGLHPDSPGITINDPGCVGKTYPRFFDDLERMRSGDRAGTGGRHE